MNRSSDDCEQSSGAGTLRDLAGRDVALDGLRGLACLLVYVHHLGLDVGRWPVTIPGYVGVHLFFVLSGYLMFGPLVAALADGRRPVVPWRRYAIRRFTRIYPPYLVALVVFSAVRYAEHAKGPGITSLLSHATMLFNYVGRNEFFRINIVFWTLAIEAQFYVALPLAVEFSARIWGRPRGWAAAWTVVVGFVATGLIARGLEFTATEGWEGEALQTRYFTLLSFLDLFGAGMAAACLARFARGPLGNRTSARWAVTGLGVTVFVAAASWSHEHAPGGCLLGPDLTYTVAAPFLLSFGGALLVLGTVTRPIGRSAGPLTWSPLVAVGTVSYSMYLYHIGFQIIAWRMLGRLGVIPTDYTFASIFVGSLAFGPTLALSALLYAAIERPALRWGARYSQHESPIVPPHAATGRGPDLEQGH